MMVLVLMLTVTNANSEFVKYLLLIAGDIESNPGPPVYKIQKSVLGSFHQGHPKFRCIQYMLYLFLLSKKYLYGRYRILIIY